VTENAFHNRLAQSLEQASRILAAAGCEAPRLDSEVLLAHVLGQDRAWLYAHPEYVLSPTQSAAYQSLVSRRAQREPVAYLTHQREFYARDFFVTCDVLIPRPETEGLVERAIQWVKTSSVPGTILDIGTGSGAIAVSLAVNLPGVEIVATDTSSAALAVARHNAAHHGVASRVTPLQGDLLAPLRGPLGLVVANPPYLSRAELAEAPPEVARWEPRAALDGGPDGLDVIRRLLGMASGRLGPGAALLVEIGAGQGSDVLGLAHGCFPGATVEIARDYADRDRMLFVRFAQ
jgi:release factor glutamine methyltransferase